MDRSGHLFPSGCHKQAMDQIANTRRTAIAFMCRPWAHAFAGTAWDDKLSYWICKAFAGTTQDYVLQK